MSTDIPHIRNTPPAIPPLAYGVVPGHSRLHQALFLIALVWLGLQVLGLLSSVGIMLSRQGTPLTLTLVQSACWPGWGDSVSASRSADTLLRLLAGALFVVLLVLKPKRQEAWPPVVIAVLGLTLALRWLLMSFYNMSWPPLRPQLAMEYFGDFAWRFQRVGIIVFAPMAIAMLWRQGRGLTAAQWTMAALACSVAFLAIVNPNAWRGVFLRSSNGIERDILGTVLLLLKSACYAGSIVIICLRFWRSVAILHVVTGLLIIGAQWGTIPAAARSSPGIPTQFMIWGCLDFFQVLVVGSLWWMLALFVAEEKDAIRI